MNGGNMIQPYMVENAAELGDGSTAVAPGTVWKSGVFSAEAAETVKQALRHVITEGTGTQAQMEGLTLAGKTGTAEIKASQDDTTGTELGWFIGFEVDNNNDPVMILMMIEDVKERGGSHYVVPKVAEAFSLYRAGTDVQVPAGDAGAGDPSEGTDDTAGDAGDTTGNAGDTADNSGDIAGNAGDTTGNASE